MQLKSKRDATIILGLVLVCFSMRSPISPVGPLVSQIKATLDLSSGFAGLLTTIPLLLFGIVSSFSGQLLNKFSDKVLICSCLALSFLGVLLRSYLGMGGLLFGTCLIGLGLGILNVVMPVFIRTNYREKIGVVMGTYSMSMNFMSALSSGFAVPLSSLLGGWSNALASFAVLPVIAVFLWLLAAKQGFVNRQQTKGMTLIKTAKSKINWFIALFMGVQSSVFFCLIAWLPSILVERGATKEEAGFLMLLMQLVGVFTNFLMPVLMQRFPKKRGLLSFISGAIYLSGFLVLLQGVMPFWQRVLSVVLLGLASGLCFSYALTSIAMQGKDPQETSSISAFSHCIGYTLAAPVPAFLGLLYDASGSFYLPVFTLILICFPIVLTGIGASGGFRPAASREH